MSHPGSVPRDEAVRRITCRGQDLDGAPLELTSAGLLARIFQHETDHLEGMLFIDRLDDEGRRSVLAELRRIELGLEDPPPKRRLLRESEG